MAGVVDLVLILVVLGGAYYIIQSGVLNNLGQPAVATTPTTDTTTTPTTDTTGTTPTTGTGSGPLETGGTTGQTSTGNPIQDLINQLLGGSTTNQGGINTVPYQTQPVQQQPIYQQPVYGGDPTKCQNTYHGKCDTECSSGNQSLCQSCQLACGGAQIGVVQPGGTSSGTGTRTTECKSRYNGSCNTECSSGNSSLCSSCRAACGLYTHAYYVHSPSNPIGSTVFKNANYSAYSNWGNVTVQNAR